jgi:hypothetical protein
MQELIKSPKLKSNSNEKIKKNPNCCNHDPDALEHNFGDFIEVDFDLDVKTSFNPYDLFFHHTNLQKIISGRNYFKCGNTAKRY